MDSLNALGMNPTFTSGEHSPSFVNFLNHIERAVPSAEDDENNTNKSWGHSQFTAGQLTCSSVLDSLASVGSPMFAGRLIATAVTMCCVSRWLCKTKSTLPTFYISVKSLNKTSRLLWACWTSAGGTNVKGKEKEVPASLASSQVVNEIQDVGASSIIGLEDFKIAVSDVSGFLLTHKSVSNMHLGLDRTPPQEMDCSSSFGCPNKREEGRGELLTIVC